MGSNWNVQRAEPDMEKLQHSVDEWQDEANAALKEEEGGKYSRRYLNAVYLLRIAQRKLEAAQAQAKQREDDEKRTAKEIVDSLIGDRGPGG
jgi:hypothetical protein